MCVCACDRRVGWGSIYGIGVCVYACACGTCGYGRIFSAWCACVCVVCGVVFCVYVCMVCTGVCVCMWCVVAWCVGGKRYVVSV